MVSLIEDVRSRTHRKALKVWLIHMNNARPRNSRRAQRCIEALRAERLWHLAYSPDLAPSDLFLFGYTQTKLSGYNCEGREDLLNPITEIFTGVDQEVLLNVFKSYVNWLKWVIKHEGKYYTM
jgi:hypothetical protein